MKKYLSIICALAMIASLSGCGSSGSGSSSSSSSSSDSSSESSSAEATEEEEKSSEAEEETEKESEEPETEAKKSDDSPVKILSHSLSKDYNGKDVLVVEYSWTNTDDEETSFTFAVADKAFQNGVECDSTVIGCDEIDSQKQLADITPGTTLTLKVGYHISDNTNVTIKCTDLFGSKTLLEETIDLGGGAGSEAANNNAENNVGDTTVKMTGHRLGKDYKGKDVLIVDYEFYNGEDEAESFMWLFSDQAFQNGVECSDLTLGVDGYDSQLVMNEITPGTTYTVSEAYILTDMSDVTVKVADLFGGKTYIEETISLQ